MVGNRHREWPELSPARKWAVVALGAVEVLLAGVAWADLARRPARAVNGSKKWWALVIAVNFAGPVAYFRWGRKRP
ncbi:PLDc N-terminal domain-containing protein [Actinosynnema sp. NPDC053489]|uniref:PLDc N-terminal domain-containing protein n=1 Tax=Actinosynnema sp. NPDC053489 TaxID=3363916 RepID=UPI0037CB8F32